MFSKRHGWSFYLNKFSDNQSVGYPGNQWKMTIDQFGFCLATKKRKLTELFWRVNGPYYVHGTICFGQNTFEIISEADHTGQSNCTFFKAPYAII